MTRILVRPVIIIRKGNIGRTQGTDMGARLATIFKNQSLIEPVPHGDPTTVSATVRQSNGRFLAEARVHVGEGEHRLRYEIKPQKRGFIARCIGIESLPTQEKSK